MEKLCELYEYALEAERVRADNAQQKLDQMGKKLSLNAIGGPCTSYELVAHDQTEVAFCGKDLKILEKLKKTLWTHII